MKFLDDNDLKRLTFIETVTAGVRKGVKFYKYQCECGQYIYLRPDDTKKDLALKACNCDKQVPEYQNLVPVKWFEQQQARAARKNLEFTVTIVDLEKQLIAQDFRCQYLRCGIGFQDRATIRKYKKYESCIWSNTASLDRIDSSKGYVPGNVQFLMYYINIMKNRYPEHTYLQAAMLTTITLAKNSDLLKRSGLYEEFERLGLSTLLAPVQPTVTIANSPVEIEIITDTDDKIEEDEILTLALVI